MKIGDLIEFYSTYELFRSDYRERNPGLVIHIRNSALNSTQKVDVLWRTGEQTSEHGSYLRLLNESR